MLDYELMKHQKDAVWRSTFMRDLFLAWEMGTGKSCATINIIRTKCQEAGRQRRVLILGPVVILRNWKKEFEMFSKIKNVHVLEGSLKKRAKKVEELEDRGAVLVTNYEAMDSRELFESLVKWRPEILVCDECHYLKNYKSKRAQAVGILSDLVEHRYMLTGTPILNSPMDLFQQFRILDGYLGRESTFGKNFFAFRNMYFEDENAAWSGRPNHFPKWVPRPSTFAELSRKISAKTIRVTKKDCLDLPPLVTQEIDVELSPEQAKLYKSMRDNFIAFLKDAKKSGEPHAVIAELAITKALRMQQIVSGFIKTEKGETLALKKVPRLDALRDLLEQLTPSHKVIVWSIFRENYRRIAELCRSLGVDFVEIHGGIDNKEKFANAERFNTDPAVRVLIGNQSAGGVGINLVASDYSIYYSRGFRLGDDLQSEARNHRRGSEVHDKITRINLIARGTLDELIAEALAGKYDVSEKIMSLAERL